MSNMQERSQTSGAESEQPSEATGTDVTATTGTLAAPRCPVCRMEMELNNAGTFWWHAGSRKAKGCPVTSIPRRKESESVGGQA
ncbi:MAG TPA: hypothetical protein VNN73_17430 [Blastocatellia bacterium]|nr:hypothetical protein [Blastocatellia bacterium]